MRILSQIILVMLSTQTFGQSTSDLLSDYFSGIRSGKQTPLPENLTKSESASSILASLTPYYKDTAAIVRHKAYALTFFVATRSANQTIRQRSVEQLIEGCKDPDTGNVGLFLSYLKEFRKDDFSAKAKEAIRSLFYSKPPHLDKLFKLIGFLQIEDLKENIRFFTQSGDNDHYRWAAIVSLARMGDPAAIRDMMSRVQKLPVNDDVIFTIFADLVYTRQKQALDYTIIQLYSNEKNCTTANPEAEGKIICAYRIMELVAPAIQGYPFKLDESGDIDTENYQDALGTVRDWFKANSNYTMMTSTY